MTRQEYDYPTMTFNRSNMMAFRLLSSKPVNRIRNPKFTLEMYLATHKEDRKPIDVDFDVHDIDPKEDEEFEEEDNEEDPNEDEDE